MGDASSTLSTSRSRHVSLLSVYQMLTAAATAVTPEVWQFYREQEKEGVEKEKHKQRGVGNETNRGVWLRSGGRSEG